MKKLILNLIILLGICNILIAKNGLNFDGVDDVVQTNYSGVLGSENRTFEAWIFINANAPSSPLAIVDYGVNIAGSRNTFSVSGSKQLTFISGGGTGANISSPPNIVLIDRWVHVAFVLDNGTGFLYLDGEQVGTGDLTDVDTPADQNLKIGQRVTGGSIPFHGSIDEVRIWDTARSQAEIQENIDKELCSNDPDLQLYLRFNQGEAGGDNTTITNAIDDSSNSYMAALTSFSLTSSISNWVVGATLASGFSYGSTTISACDSYTWAADSITYNTSGNYSAVIPLGNINGCDSIASIDLTITTAADSTTNISNCDSYTWAVNGQTYTTSTTVIEPQISNIGCPYNHTLNLNLIQSSFDTMNITTCEEYTWPTNGQTYTNTGLYTEMYSAANGCDSMVTLNLNISPPDTSVTFDGDLTMTSDEANASYQWLDCDNGNAAIDGATSQSYTASSNGNFAVEITTPNGCIDTSACITIDDFTSIEIIDVFGEITLFPNPTKSNTMLSFGKQVPNVKIIITDVVGRIVSTASLRNVKATTIDIEGGAGIYFIQITDSANHRTVLKLVKE